MFSTDWGNTRLPDQKERSYFYLGITITNAASRRTGEDPDGRSQHDRHETAGALQARPSRPLAKTEAPVSYTHLTLPTIYSV